MLFVFLDGVGIGPSDPDVNPFLRAELPRLRSILGGIPTLDHPVLHGPSARSLPLDATLGVAGRPQSGTGQTSLLTGANGAVRFGRHFGPWTPVALRDLLAEQNVLVQARRAGRSIAFANAYPRGYPDGVPTRRQAAPPLAALAAGALVRHDRALAQGRAVASGITNEGWRRHLGFTDLPRVDPETAGGHLAHIAKTADLTLFAHYDTDYAGHAGTARAAVGALERVDAFLGGVVDGLPAGGVLVVASDHGNVEELTGRHTRNPVLGLVHVGTGTGAPESAVAGGGAGADGQGGGSSRGVQNNLPDLAGLDAITDVPGWILGMLGVDLTPR